MKSAGQGHCVQGGHSNLRDSSEYQWLVFRFHLGCWSHIHCCFRSSWCQRLPHTLGFFPYSARKEQGRVAEYIVPHFAWACQVGLRATQPQLTETTAASSHCSAFHTQPCSATFRPERGNSTTPSRKSPSHLQLRSSPRHQPTVTVTVQLQSQTLFLYIKKAKENKRICPFAVLGHPSKAVSKSAKSWVLLLYLGRDFTEYPESVPSSIPIMIHWSVKASKKWD